MTSHDVVGRVRRALKTKRVGHAGTLDPDATGVLVVAVGQATRLLPYLPLEPKVYLATVGFGTATDTEDASGQVTATADASGLTEEALRSVLPRFVGEIAQVPPMVSALHHNGQRLYDLARQGITVEREARTITIHALELVAPPSLGAGGAIRVTCGGGTYIRTLCKDIGEALGLPAHMATLVREAVGPYALADAIPLEEIDESKLLPMHEALGWPLLDVSDADAAELKLGRTIQLTPPFAKPEGVPEPCEGGGGENTCAALHNGQLLALLRYETGRWQPFKVFAG
ncbi:tRNA pseudouridine55 synthase [Armatimonas rosea]|uniref:tRNA pseudouridine synthase B n=2 Tax=Armatimonas rosea TaxID=685828 RepID=A0A7W9W9Z7_ARMRO|nr:tRNA pseudouridine55 synthase [Armatimonas rosea]